MLVLQMNNKTKIVLLKDGIEIGTIEKVKGNTFGFSFPHNIEIRRVKNDSETDKKHT